MILPKQGIIEEWNNIEQVREQEYILYCYIDRDTDEVVYIGKDKNGNKNRRKIEHEAPAHVKKQFVNAELQKDPTRYWFQIVGVFADEGWMIDSEAILIAFFKKQGQCQFNIENELG